ncbi:MAG: hypothetical protein MJ089_03395 [Ruminococcus sp.]|nr:hypothetical protein [Ruminococcus sp.]
MKSGSVKFIFSAFILVAVICMSFVTASAVDEDDNPVVFETEAHAWDEFESQPITIPYEPEVQETTEYNEPVYTEPQTEYFEPVTDAEPVTEYYEPETFQQNYVVGNNNDTDNYQSTTSFQAPTIAKTVSTNNYSTNNLAGIISWGCVFVGIIVLTVVITSTKAGNNNIQPVQNSQSDSVDINSFSR